MDSKTFEVTYKYHSDTKGTYKYVALDSKGEQITESQEKLNIGSNILYVQKNSVMKGDKPQKILATFTLM